MSYDTPLLHCSSYASFCSINAQPGCSEITGAAAILILMPSSLYPVHLRHGHS
ncbi:hypothetical protein FIBSPDRAFT_851309 [Athelia psychrophila]|uniref:Uncharacterized protein n=1 Tax=Athelia psychrophila TaxID=1759441 RepID=A0A166SPM7_9AGAM|nr:hypothetical protein FIBSPDRAFT_851309 [Fibularhizoctonia sp. CBS 109695]